MDVYQLRSTVSFANELNTCSFAAILCDEMNFNKLELHQDCFTVVLESFSMFVLEIFSNKLACWLRCG